jgi:hypothetical protein
MATTDPLARTRSAPPNGRGVLQMLREIHHLWDFTSETSKRNASLVEELEASPVVEREEAAA